jgi:hypothetical protein
MCRLYFLLLAVMLGSNPAFAQAPQVDYTSPHIQFPADSGVVDVTQPPYEADPTGQRDSTASFQQAIDDLTMKGVDAFGWREILYVPNGTYRLSDSLRFSNDRDEHSSEGGGPNIIGESRDGVVLQLDDNLPAFQNADQPTPVISTINAGKWGNVAFMLSMMNFTIDTGAGNPGASGVRYIASNQGSLRDITIRSGDPDRVGYAGIDMFTSSIPGPALIKHVKIEGFDHAIKIGSPHYTMTLEHLEIADQRVSGIHCHQHSLTIRGLTSENDVPALVSDHRDGLVVLIDSTLKGGKLGLAAIQNQGEMLLRNISIQGYDTPLEHRGESQGSGSSITEWVSLPVTNVVDAQQQVATLNLPVEETPAVPWDDPSTWVSAAKYIENSEKALARNNWNDDSDAIQKAIDSMRGDQRTLYFPPGFYKVDQTLELRGNVRRVVGMWNAVSTSPRIEKQMKPMFLIPKDKAEIVWIDMFNDAPVPRRKANGFLENRSAHDVVLQSVYIAHGKAYRNADATGRLFLEDVTSLHHIFYAKHTGDKEELALPEANPQWEFKDQTVWARQFNPEFFGTMARSDGGQVWMLGVKTETLGTMMHAENGARVELLGGTFLPSYKDVRGMPAYVIDNADMAMSVAEMVGVRWQDGQQIPRASYDTVVKETANVETAELTKQEAPNRLDGRAFMLPLYRSVDTAK